MWWLLRAMLSEFVELSSAWLQRGHGPLGALLAASGVDTGNAAGMTDLSALAVSLGVAMAMAAILAYVLFSMLMHSEDAHYTYKQGSRVTDPIVRHMQSKVPPFNTKFRLFSGHVHSLFFARMKQPPRECDVFRQIMTMEDGGTVALDWVTLCRDGKGHETRASGLPADAPVLVMIPTITGKTKELLHLCKDALELGYRPVVFIKRGHDNLKLATPRLAAFGDYSDFEVCLKHIRTRFPSAPLVSASFSAGSSIISSYLGAKGPASMLRASVLVSPGYDPTVLIQRSKIQWPYRSVILSGLKRIVAQNADMLSKRIDVDGALKAKTLSEFDHKVFMQLNGYTDPDVYWRDNHPLREIENTGVPMLCLNAMDDPVCTPDLIPFEQFGQHDNLIVVTTERGGHCGWYVRAVPDFDSWAHDVIFSFFEAAGYAPKHRAQATCS